jgi:hypothetical protein
MNREVDKHMCKSNYFKNLKIQYINILELMLI